MISNENKKKLTRAALTGTTLAIASSVVFGNGSINFAGMETPAAVPLFLGGAAVSAINDMVHESVLLKPSITTSYLAGDLASTAISAAVVGGITVGVLSSAVGLPSDRYLSAAALGAGSVVASDLVESRYLEQRGQLIF